MMSVATFAFTQVAKQVPGNNLTSVLLPNPFHNSGEIIGLAEWYKAGSCMYCCCSYKVSMTGSFNYVMLDDELHSIQWLTRDP
jgi:hypothetical protein